MYEGYPVLTLGTTDHNKSFHPFGIGIATNETNEEFQCIFEFLKDNYNRITGEKYEPSILIADAAESITNGFKQAFNILEKRVVCWAHMIRKVDDRLKPIKNKEYKKEIRQNIVDLQVCFNENVFRKALELFFNKWQAVKSPEIESFIAYFKTEWCSDGRDTWYEGYALKLPSHSNAIESTHKHMKSSRKIRSRLGIVQFLNNIEKGMLYNWSIIRNSTLNINDKIVPNKNFKPFATEPCIEIEDWTNSYKWYCKKLNIYKMSMCNNQFEYFATDEAIIFDKNFCYSYIETVRNCSWNTFDDLIYQIKNYFLINIDYLSWTNSTCTCSFWLKNYKCNHVIGLSLKLGKPNSFLFSNSICFIEPFFLI